MFQSRCPDGLSGERSALAFISTTTEHTWTPEIIEQLRLVAGVFGLALAREESHQALLCALGQAGQLRERRAVEDLRRRPSAGDCRTSRAIVSDSAAMRVALEQIELVAPTPATVLLLGETGTGKEVLAKTIHDLSPRRHRPMIRVNCGAIPAALIESELFGRERGAYTGAITRQIGRFEAAHQSTLFLDEIGELPVETQVKLLRVLQERVIERLGSPHPIKVDVRIIAATNRRLEEAMRNKSFREDLFYRLNVFPCTVPPLRERSEDLPGLVWAFIDEFSKSFGKPIESIASDSMRADAGVFVARQRARTAQSHRTRRHPGDGTPSDGANAAARHVIRGAESDDACQPRARPHPRDAREHQVADSRRGRRRRASGPQADDA